MRDLKLINYWLNKPSITICLFLLFIQSAFVSTVIAEESKQDCNKIYNAFDRRLCVEQQISKQSFVLIPYKLNYFIGSYVKDIDETNPIFDNFESKFQISFKIPLSDYNKSYRCLWINNTSCYTFLGYTQLSVWKMLNFDHSAPFWDTNFEPELMISQLLNKKLLGNWKLRLINLRTKISGSPFSREWRVSETTVGEDLS